MVENTTMTRQMNFQRFECFHREIGFFLCFGQFFGIMPISGIREKDVVHVRFEWKSLKFVYALFHMLSAFISAIFCCIRFAIFGFLLDKTATLSFYICNFFALSYFVYLAQNWRELICEWSKIDSSMPECNSIFLINKRFKIITCCIFSLALVEHIFFILNALYLTWEHTHEGKGAIDLYFKFAFPHVFCVIQYSHWKAFFVEIANVLTTICWNFTDAFIMLVSTGLALRFKQVSNKIQRVRLQSQPFWQEIREDYNNLSRLCQLVDAKISPLVTISFVNNLFFICIQLYNTLKPRHGFIPSVYFFYSFGFLLARTIAVSLYAAWINDESRSPLPYLLSVSSEQYFLDVERLMQQIHFAPVGITGSNFFLISRSFLLRVSGTIITFELMLLQFGPIINDEKSIYGIAPNATVTDKICLQ